MLFLLRCQSLEFLHKAVVGLGVQIGVDQEDGIAGQQNDYSEKQDVDGLQRVGECSERSDFVQRRNLFGGRAFVAIKSFLM